jgi:metal transporter CNNM
LLGAATATRQQRCKPGFATKAMLTAESCEAALAGSAHVADAAAACADLVTNLQRRRLSEDAKFATFDEVQDYVDLACVIVIVACAALAAGLTMGVTSLESSELRVIVRTGTAKEKGQASRLLPLVERRPHHQVLVTLLLCNSLANEALPIFVDKLAPTWAAVDPGVPSCRGAFTPSTRVVSRNFEAIRTEPRWSAQVLFSVVFVLVFGEILPSAIFTGPSQLRMAALCAPLVKCVLAVFSPITYPISLLLDHYLPEEDDCEEPDEIVARVEVERELAQLRGRPAPFTADESNLVRGVMALRRTTVADVYVPLKRVATVSASAPLTLETLQALRDAGHSRIPLRWSQTPGDWRDFILVKELVGCQPDATITLSRTGRALRTPHWVSLDQSLPEVLDLFQQGQSHVAFVSMNPQRLASCRVHDRETLAVGIVTLEDVVEELITEEIYDEDDRRIAKRVVGNFILRKWFGRSAVLQRATLSGRRASLERGSVSPPSRRGSVRGRLRASSTHETSVASTVGRALRRLGSQTSTAGERRPLVLDEGADVV